MTKRKIAGSIIDPTLPKTPITIDGKEYNLCFDFGALAEAEAAFNAQGYAVNLLAALPSLNLSSTRIIFAASLRNFQADIDYKDAVKLVTLKNVYTIADAVINAWKEALPEPEPDSGNADAAAE